MLVFIIGLPEALVVIFAIAATVTEAWRTQMGKVVLNLSLESRWSSDCLLCSGLLSSRSLQASSDIIKEV